MTEDLQESVRELIDGINDLEQRIARRRSWPEDRKETGLSPLAERWLELDRLHHEHLEEEGYRRTLHVFSYLVLEVRSPGADTETPTPTPVNSEAAGIITDLAEYDRITLAEALVELFPDDVDDNEITPTDA